MGTGGCQREVRPLKGPEGTPPEGFLTPPLKLRLDPPPKMAPKGPKALRIFSSLLWFPKAKNFRLRREVLMSQHILGLLQRF